MGRKEKKMLQQDVITTTHSTPILFRDFFIRRLCVHSSIDRLHIFGAVVVVRPERRY